MMMKIVEKNKYCHKNTEDTIQNIKVKTQTARVMGKCNTIESLSEHT